MSDKSIKPLLVSIVGPTAVGKTALAIHLAQYFNTEIISADSRQFFREMHIGTAKPSKDELAQVKHHFIDSHSISENYNAGEFGRDATEVIRQLHEDHPVVIVVGGSTLYLKALWEGFDDMPVVEESIRTELNVIFETQGIEPLLKELKATDPVYFNEVDQQNHQRIIRGLEIIRASGQPFSSFRKSARNEMPYENLKIGLNLDRELLFERINTRMDQMIEEGLFMEAERLVDFQDHNALQTVGYSEIFGYLNGDYDREEAIRLLKRNSRRYAKRQMTWFRRYDDIHWFNPNQSKEIIALIESRLP